MGWLSNTMVSRVNGLGAWLKNQNGGINAQVIDTPDGVSGDFGDIPVLNTRMSPGSIWERHTNSMRQVPSRAARYRLWKLWK